MLATYRDYVAGYNSSDLSRLFGLCVENFDMTLYVKEPRARHPGVLNQHFDTDVFTLCGEQSLVFHIPGWQTWTIYHLARMRILDEMVEDEVFPVEDLSGVDGCDYIDMLVDQMVVLDRKEYSDEALERYMRGPVLDIKGFWAFTELLY